MTVSMLMAKGAKLEDDALDSYAKAGVIISRDAAHRVIAALERDAYEMESRGGEPNLCGAAENRALAKMINVAMR